MKNIRDLSFDALKLFAIFLVLWGHCIQYLSPINSLENYIYRIIYSFHMPLFMAISGYFSLSSMTNGIIPFVKKKTVQLILPCITWSFVLLFLSNIHQDVNYSLSQFLLKYVENFHLNFWFLKSAFLCYLIVYIGRRFVKNEFLFYILSTIIVELTMDFYHMHTMYPSFIMGLILRQYKSIWHGKRKVAISVFTIFGLLLIFWDTALFTSSQVVFNNRIFDFIFNSSYKLLIGLIGAFSIISMFSCFFNKVANNRFLSICKMGQYTLGVYILQTIIIEKELSFIFSLDKINIGLFTFVFTPLVSFITLVVCVYTIKLISLNKTLSLFCFGKA